MARDEEKQWVFRDRYPERTAAYAQMEALGRRACADLPYDAALAYGEHPSETFNLFTGQSGKPIVVFFHGGYWQGLSPALFHFMATPLASLGLSVAFPGYPLAPEASLTQVVASACRAIDAIVDAALKRDLKPAGWIAAGHSAGGHLSLLTSLPRRAIPLLGVVAISPICDLTPLCKTTLNEVLKLSSAEVCGLSPLHLPVPLAPVHLLVGRDETLGFRRQAHDYSAKLTAAGQESRLHELPNLNHYTICLDICRRNSPILEAFGELAGQMRRQGKDFA